MATPGKDKQIPCPNEGCHLMFNNRTSKKRHLDSRLCQGTPAEKEELIKIVKGDDGKYHCTVCNETISQVNNVQRHRNRCKGPKSAKSLYQCDVLIVVRYSKLHSN